MDVKGSDGATHVWGIGCIVLVTGDQNIQAVRKFLGRDPVIILKPYGNKTMYPKTVLFSEEDPAILEKLKVWLRSRRFDLDDFRFLNLPIKYPMS